MLKKIFTYLKLFPQKHKILTAFAALSILFITYAIIILPSTVFKPDFSTVILDTNGEILRVYLNNQQQWQLPYQPAKIPDKLEKAVLFYEDENFYYHPGINPLALLRATGQIIVNGRIISGGSTLTMQTARLAAPKKRTFFNKFTEMVQALYLELRFSKAEIFRLYLENAPYGGNIVGIPAASRRYFAKEAEYLTWAEAALLAVIPNSPSMINPVKNSPKLLLKRNKLLYRLYQSGAFDRTTLLLSMRENIPTGSIPFPLNVPQLSNRLKKDQPGTVIKTTIDLSLQNEANQICQRYAGSLRELGIANLAVIVAETQSGKVRAYVGSQDFRDSSALGEIDGVQALRSSGSVLKPFLYAQAFGGGVIQPQSLLEDIPVNYGSFSPVNADRRYNGLIQAEDALTRSLNVPAVRLLSEIGLTDFYTLLLSGGITSFTKTPEHYGLTLILGGAEVQLAELAALYRTLGRMGKYSPLQYLDSTGVTTNRQIFSPGASWLTLNILKDVKRPGSEVYWPYFDSSYPLAWKTGTSFGNRDAWAVGVSPEWTIGVWTGNFQGGNNPNLSGTNSSGPLLFQIFHSLPKQKGQNWFTKPANDLHSVTVCKASGFSATENCLEQTTVEIPKRAEILKPCPYHKKIFVGTSGRYEVCSLCWSGEEVKAQIRLIYPPAAVSYLKISDAEGKVYPPHKADCPAHANSAVLDFLYPVENAYLAIGRDFDGKFQKVKLIAVHQQAGSVLFWYSDGELLGKTRGNHQIMADFSAGKHKLTIVDQDGRKKSISVFIEKAEK